MSHWNLCLGIKTKMCQLDVIIYAYDVFWMHVSITLFHYFLIQAGPCLPQKFSRHFYVFFGPSLLFHQCILLEFLVYALMGAIYSSNDQLLTSVNISKKLTPPSLVSIKHQRFVKVKWELPPPPLSMMTCWNAQYCAGNPRFLDFMSAMADLWTENSISQQSFPPPALTVAFLALLCYSMSLRWGNKYDSYKAIHSIVTSSS